MPRSRATLFALVLLGCTGGAPARPAPAESTLVFERPNGSRVHFAREPVAWCGPWEEGEVPVETVHVRVRPAAAGQPWWMLRAVVRDVKAGEPLAFPNSYVWDQPGKADLFVLDPPNELSTQQRSSGSITFQKLDCGAGGEVRFSIDAVVGSELHGGPPLTARGSFRAPVGRAPS